MYFFVPCSTPLTTLPQQFVLHAEIKAWMVQRSKHEWRPGKGLREYVPDLLAEVLHQGMNYLYNMAFSACIGVG